ncbi:MAG: hypothetical protein ACHP9T_08285 [Caulobacterales bacterium]|jgi:hypothetical protein
MNDPAQATALAHHTLNNLFGKILGAAELALDQPCGAQVCRELQTIMALAEEGGCIVSEMRLGSYGD